MKLHFAICIILLLNAAHIESRRQGASDDADQRYKLFVFGDSFADTGNVPMSDKSGTSRAWYYPYGSSDYDHDKKPTGRFSNGMVQSDFVAKILGLDESPPAERLRGQIGVDPFGMNFAVGGAGAYEVSREAPTLGEQIDKFMRLVRHGIIDEDLKDSVALVAFSGSHDYARVNMSSYADIVALAKNVVDTIADGVDRLQELGVQKVLVNSLPPLGCRPWWSRSNNYTACYGPQDVVTSVHNMYLKQKLGESDTILLLDLNTIFINIIVSHGSSPFKHRFTPCCDSFDPVGYCGQEDEDGDVQYSICSVPDQSFYWDYMHPTQAGWKAVMEQLEEPIKGFLDI